MRKSIFYIISLFLGIVLFVFTIKQAGIGSILKSISFFPIKAVIAVFIANFFAAIIISAWRWKVVIEAQDNCKISFFKVLMAKMAGFAMSYVTPSVFVGGEPVRVYMLKESVGCTWEKALASAIIDQAVYFFSLLLLMITGFLFLADHFALPRSVSYGFWIVIIFSILVLYVFYKKIIAKKENQEGFFMFILNILRLRKIKYIRRREGRIRDTEKIISEFFKNRRRALLQVFLLAIAEVLAYLTVIWVIASYLNLGDEVSVFRSISIFAIITLASFVPIPGSLGSMEASITYIFELLSLGGGNGFTFSLVFRLVNILTVIIGFTVIICFELKNLADKFMNAPNELSAIHKFFLSILRKKQ